MDAAKIGKTPSGYREKNVPGWTEKSVKVPKPCQETDDIERKPSLQYCRNT